jgi:hypothetical protein
MAEAYVVKLLYDNTAAKPLWVMAEHGRGLGSSRETATVFPNRAAADAEAKIWKALPSPAAFTVVVEPA